MTKKLKILLTFILTIIITACSHSRPEELNDLILAPELGSPILEGTWQVRNIDSISDKANEVNIKIGDKLYINKNLVAINNEYASPPTFSSKYVNLNDYLTNRINEFSKIDQEEMVVVVNASQGQFFSRDFIKRSDDEIFYIADDNLVYLTRLSYNVDPEVVNKYKEMALAERTASDQNQVVAEDIAVLLGVRERVDKPNNQQDYNYYTYLIRITPEEKVKSKKAQDIFLRGQDEYLKVRCRKNTMLGTYDTIEAFPVRVENQMDQQNNISRYSFKRIDMNMKMNFVDREYISFSYQKTIFDNSVTKYGTLDTDDLKDNRLLTIDEYTGEKDASEQFENLVINEAINKVPGIDTNNLDIDNKNFGLVRDAGTWVSQTSIFTEDGQQMAASPIPIRTHLEDRINPTTITRDQVRNISGQFKDFHILNNNNYIIIQNQDEILIHRIKNDVIEKRPFYSISTPNPTAFVSIDQQSGNNAETLEKSFLNFNEIID